MIKPVLYLFVFLVLINSAIEARADSLSARSTPASLIITYDPVHLPGDEVMGLLGGSYFLGSSPLQVGFASYGAATGQRGGFFTIGFSTRYQYNISTAASIVVDAFIGGGGGGAAPQGGGLMLRSGLTAMLPLSDVTQLSLGYSWIDYPNGEISSGQLSSGIQWSFDQWVVPGLDFDHHVLIHAPPVGRYFQLQSSHYYPDAHYYKRSGRGYADRLDLLGVRFTQHWKQSLQLEFETAGAWNGNIDGFAQIFSGLGWRQRLDTRWRVSSTALIGLAGGGDVDTAGGGLVKINAGLQYRLWKQFWLDLRLGYLQGIEDRFVAKTVELGFGKQYEIPGKGLSGTAPASSSWKLAPMRVRAGGKYYHQVDNSARKHDYLDYQHVGLTQLKLDYFINPWLYLSGQGVAAMTGGAGGYAEGLTGIGMHKQFSSSSSWWLGPELSIGAAGGGGLDVGAGALVQGLLQTGMLLKNNIGLTLGMGYIYALEGSLRRPFIDLTLDILYSVPRR